MKTIRFFALAASLLVATVPATFAGDAVAVGGGVSMTAIIEKIDPTERLVTIKDDSGEVQVIKAGPEIQRFNELKVGDKVTFTYTEALVYQVARTDAKVTASSVKAEVTRAAKTEPPAGAMRTTQTAVVEVQAVDLSVPSVTIKNAEGKVRSFKVKDKSLIEGLAAGNKVEVSYSEALFVDVKHAAPAK